MDNTYFNGPRIGNDTSREMHNPSLPRYSIVTDNTIPLPAYSTPSPNSPRYSPVVNTYTSLQDLESVRALTTEHKFNINNGKTPWSTLEIFSRAGSSTNAPKFFEGDKVAGSVALFLDSPQTINTITVSIKGRIITASTGQGSEIYNFLDYPVLVWSKAHGDPRQPSSMGNASKFDGKLTPGEYIWPFRFSFPVEISLRGERQALSQLYRTPQSFSERDTRVTLQYDILLHISRGKLKLSTKFRTPIIYVPNITPSPPSSLRQRAYHENKPLPGPLEDPQGWFTLPAAKIRGRIFQQRTIELECRLSVANPLCYTQGTVIPCSLSIQSTDAQALDMLASPKTVSVGLQQHIKYFSSERQMKQGIYTVEVQDIQTAVWWSPSNPTTQELQERRIEGEIHLPNNLQPSSDFMAFIVEYSIRLLPFQSTVFTAQEGVDGTSSTQAVTIGTRHAQGPPPREYAVRQSSNRSPAFQNIPIFLSTDLL